MRMKDSFRLRIRQIGITYLCGSRLEADAYPGAEKAHQYPRFANDHRGAWMPFSIPGKPPILPRSSVTALPQAFIVSSSGMPETCPAAISVLPDDRGKRLDQFLAAHLGVSRARIQQLISEQKVLVDDTSARPSLKLRGGERIQVLGQPERPPLRAIPEEIPLDILYEDDDLAIVNKPAGMMVHAGAGATDDQRNRGTLVNALLHHFASLSGVSGEMRPGIVHRLDKETSGLIVVAKNDDSHRKLAFQFARREVHKKYAALVQGWMKKDAGTIAASISRDRIRRTRMTTR